MTRTAKSPLKGLTERQLSFVQFLAQYPKVMLDVTESYRYSRGFQRGVQLAFGDDVTPEVRRTIDQEARSALGISSFRRMDRALDSVGTALLKRNLLARVAVVREGEPVSAGYARKREIVRYTLSNEVREAAGGIEQQLDEMAERVQRAIKREQEWQEAREPLAYQAGEIKRKLQRAQFDAQAAIDEPTATRLIELHTQYHKLQAELNELNALYKVVADQHGRKYEPFAGRY